MCNTPESPTIDETRELLSELGIDADEEMTKQYQETAAEAINTYERLSECESPDDLVPDSPMERLDDGPDIPTDDPLNMWARRFVLSEQETGVLGGVNVGLKDNVSVAGVPLTCGSTALEHVPTIDATVVSRLLDAGATLVGHTTMDCFSFSGVGDTSDYGPMRNPHDPERTAGGSSGGSAAAVAAGEVDISIGADQGGSVRVPASWCGVVGHKPSHGLVPYTGVVRVDNTLDHVGPFTDSVEMAARVTRVLAGIDSLDPRQRQFPGSEPEFPVIDTDPGRDPAALTVGILSEGFELDNLETEVEKGVRSTLDELEDAGASVREVSVPEHTDSTVPYMPLLTQGAATTLENGGLGYGWEGHYDTELAKSLESLVSDRLDALSYNVKAAAVVATYIEERTGLQSYGKAQNLRRTIRAAYDEALTDVDVLAMPTTPQRAMQYNPDAGGAERFANAVAPSSNTLPFNLTGHPAISVPCAKPDNLPVGIQLVGEKFADNVVFDVAATVEGLGDWRERD